MTASAASGPDGEHYLKRELYDLVRTDTSIFEFLQAGSLDGLWYWDVTAPEQEWMSPRFKELFGYEDHEVPNLSSWWMEQIHPDDLQLALDNFQRHLDDPSHPYDQVVRYRHRDGSLVWVRCRGIAVRDDDGTPIRLLGCHTDITALKEAEETLARRNEQLRNALEQTKQANSELERFAGAVAHDIKNPLATAAGFAELLRRRVDDDDEMAEPLDRIVGGLRRTQTMVDDVLQFATVVGSSGDPERISLADEVQFVLDVLQERVRESAAVVAVGELPTVLAWPAAVRQVVLNLVENSLKYRDHSRPLRIDISAGPTSRGVELCISDNGIGIAVEDREEVFQLGKRRAPVGVDGTGLGLATCRAVLSRMHGSITLGPGPGGVGTTATVVLPDGAPPEEAPPSGVMVVDDDPDALALAAYALHDTGVPIVATAVDARDAMQTYRSLDRPPALVVVDLDLGVGGSGLDVIEDIRAIEPDQTLVLRTAHLDAEVSAAAARLGARASVDKTSIDDLRDLVVRYAGAAD